MLDFGNTQVFAHTAPHVLGFAPLINFVEQWFSHGLLLEEKIAMFHHHSTAFIYRVVRVECFYVHVRKNRKCIRLHIMLRFPQRVRPDQENSKIGTAQEAESWHPTSTAFCALTRQCQEDPNYCFPMP